MDQPTSKAERGLTLIELSIVLVIVALIVGGVLVGQDLIRHAAVRAQVTQIEKFNTAVNTFREKYGYLPGDIKDPDASNFGLTPEALTVDSQDSAMETAYCRAYAAAVVMAHLWL